MERKHTRPLRNRIRDHSSEMLAEESLKSFERTKSLLRTYNSERQMPLVSPDTVDVFRLKERISEEFSQLFPLIHNKIKDNYPRVKEEDIMSPITEIQNRVTTIIQAMCNSKYKSVNPDIAIADFNALEQQRIAKYED